MQWQWLSRFFQGQCLYVENILLYSCETWSAYTRHKRKLKRFHLQCFRSICRVAWKGKDRIEFTLQRTSCRFVISSENNPLELESHMQSKVNECRLLKNILHGELS